MRGMYCSHLLPVYFLRMETGLRYGRPERPVVLDGGYGVQETGRTTEVVADRRVGLRWFGERHGPL